MSSILVIAAHPDDEILGLGGTIRRLADEGNEINCVILGEGMTSRDEQTLDIQSLHKDTLDSGKIIGFTNIHFENLPDNRFDSIDLLDVIKRVEKYVKLYSPQILFTHHYGDLNVDHRITFNAVQTATRTMEDMPTKEIYLFETPSSTEWNFSYNSSGFKPNVFFDVSKTLEFKLKAMACYESELRDYPHPRALKSLEIIALRWGITTGMEYVEAFELLRMIK